MYYIFIGILIVIITILIAVIFIYQRQVKSICRQLAFLEENDSNMMISREIDWGGIGHLTDTLNDLLAMRRKERKKYQEKERIIAETYTNLSHDIRTPLTSLDGYFQLLEKSQNPEEQKKYLKIIQERINSLKDMLEELFTFTKLKNDSFCLSLEPCCINRILKETIFSYYEDWREQGIEPEMNISEELLYMEGNAQAIRRILQNIIKNALDHGEKKLGITLEKKEQSVHLEIKNMVENPKQIDVDMVFERFYKADVSRSKNSTGLGLSIAKEFVIRMNGTIEAKIQGNEFCICMNFPKVNR